MSKKINSSRQRNIIIVVGIAIVILILIFFVIFTKFADENDQTPPPTSSPVSSPAASDTSDNSLSEEELQAARKEKIAILDENQSKFDNYMADKNFTEAFALLEDYFKTASYGLTRGNTYKNYVTYYESQGLYADSAAYQINYIEEHDGLDNVIAESLHYKTIQETLQHTSSSDTRLEAMQISVERWNSFDDLIITQGSYIQAEAELKQLIEDGLECATVYYYLANVLTKQERFVDALDVYFSYLDKDFERNTLENNFVRIFEDTVGAMQYAGDLTDEDIEPYRDRKSKYVEQ